jgi:hypothetical protein
MVKPPHRVLSRFGMPGARCTPATSGPLYYCFSCTHDFVQCHRELLTGYLAAEQSELPVAWRSAGPFASSSEGGPPALPKDKALRAQYLGCFHFEPPQSEEDAATARSRHDELQNVISEALKQDRLSLKRPADTSVDHAAIGEAPRKKRQAQAPEKKGGQKVDLVE